MRLNLISRLAACGAVLAMAACAAPASAPEAADERAAPSPPPLPTLTSAPPTATPPPATATPVSLTPTAIPEEVVADLEAWLADLGQKGLFSGAVLVANQGQVLFSHGYGLADREKHIGNTPETRFRLGSLTKQFTAMAILILEARGQLTAADSVCRYLDDCPAAWQTITLAHLLTHTSGLPNYTALPDYLAQRATPVAPAQLLARFQDLPLDFPPGQGWRYSNSGYAVLGWVIERVTGQTYAAFLRQAIIEPLGLSNTGYDHNADGVAVGYNDQYSSLPADYIDMSIPYAAGALYSTVTDLYQWDQALYTERLVPRAYLDKLTTAPAPIPDSGGWGYSYGWGILQAPGQTIWQHSGGIEGFATVITRYPDSRATIIVLSNEGDANVQEISTLLDKQLFGRP